MYELVPVHMSYNDSSSLFIREGSFYPRWKSSCVRIGADCSIHKSKGIFLTLKNKLHLITRIFDCWLTLSCPQGHALSDGLDDVQRAEMKAYMELVNNMLLTAEVQTCTHQHIFVYYIHYRSVCGESLMLTQNGSYLARVIL